MQQSQKFPRALRRPVSIADGDDVALGARADAVAASDTATSSLVGLTKRGLQHGTSIVSGLTEIDENLDALVVAAGAPADAAATTDAGAFSLIALIKRGLQHATAAVAGIGAPTDAAANSDAGTHSLIALIKRHLEKLTSGIAVGQAVTHWTNHGSSTLAAAATSAAKLKRVRGRNGSSTLYYLQLHDSATTPSSGAVPKVSMPVGIGVAEALTTEELDFGQDWVAFGSGIFPVWSSTQGTYTAATPTIQSVSVEHA